ncbi:serine hydrolase [Ideonella sp. DXS22W]|uniref:Serine hydrolase n=1 Tax=Pseudaquabacterium inlustre TaxID=2984192 RepID=A0ABU9CDX1_9BURK
MKSIPLACSAAALLWAASIAAQPQAPADNAARVQDVERGLLPAVVTPHTVPARLVDRMCELQIPGLSVAVVDRGQLAWAHAWGEARPGQAMTTDTLLQAASISKPVAAVVALRWVDRGRLTLDGDLQSHLKAWRLPAGPQTFERGVSLRRLLSHSAGLTVSGFDGYPVGAPVPTLLQVLDGSPPANSAPVRVDALPGTQWRYSGGGYSVLQQVIEDTAGQPFGLVAQHEVLVPAGMRQSFFAPSDPLAPGIQAQTAVGHSKGNPIPGGYRIHPESAAAGLWTTPSDLARFSLALPQLLGADLLAEALRPQFDESGLGFVVDRANARWGHDGSNAGFESRWLADAEGGGRAIVLMANANGARSLMNEVIRAVAVAHGWTAWMPTTQSAVVARMEATPMFVRGSLNNWGTDLVLQAVAPRRFEATSQAELPAGPIEFKIASADWRTVDLGAASVPHIAPGAFADLTLGGANLHFNVPRPGRYRFEVDATDGAGARLRVSRLE